MKFQYVFVVFFLDFLALLGLHPKAVDKVSGGMGATADMGIGNNMGYNNDSGSGANDEKVSMKGIDVKENCGLRKQSERK
ncbi:hypothetical protein DM860_002908 [Cuscuta australis]|uniref:Uncharacterized protein n=1 Tax=Cuscuta australis TaxID=267555 RepID=A0A328D0U8_9ASTE|nr:hypothetical protein DM860_002908 [Cuscuta australis]